MTAQPSLPGIELPHDLETEQHCLGGMMYRRANVPLVVDTGLEPGHFFSPKHRRLYGLVLEAWIADLTWDPGLADDGVSGYVYNAPQVSRPDLYAVEVIALADRRTALLVAAGIEPPTHMGWSQYWEAVGTKVWTA